MLAGELYVATGEELAADARRVAEWMERYNASIAATQKDHSALLREMLAEVGEGAYVRPPFHCDYGYNISLGKGVFLNFNCVILDVVKVTIGDRTQIGPGVQILTGTIRAIPSSGVPAWSSGVPSPSEPMSGSAPAPSCCRASPSVTARSWVRVPSSPATSRRVLLSLEIQHERGERDRSDAEHSRSRCRGARTVRTLRTGADRQERGGARRHLLEQPAHDRLANNEHGYGFDRIHAFRVARPPGPGTKEKRLRLDIVTLGRDMATVSLVYKVRGKEMTGRQTQTWVRFPDAGWKVVHAHVSMIAEEPITRDRRGRKRWFNPPKASGT